MAVVSGFLKIITNFDFVFRYLNISRFLDNIVLANMNRFFVSLQGRIAFGWTD